MTEFISRHIGPTEEEQTQMLDDLGLSSLDELVRQVVPDSILLRGDDMVERVVKLRSRILGAHSELPNNKSRE